MIRYLSIIAITLLLSASQVSAQTTKTATTSSATISGKPSLSTTGTPSTTPKPTTTEDAEIKNLRDKLTTKVDEMRKKNQKAISGIVTDVKDTVIKMKTADDTAYDVKTDGPAIAFYQIAGTAKKELKLKDFVKGSYIIVTGPVIDKTINANVVYQDEQFIVKSGKVAEIDKDNSIIKVAGNEKDSYELEYSRTTKYAMLNIKTLDIETTTLAKIKEGDSIHFVAKPSDPLKDTNKLAAQKIFIIPQEYFSK